MDADTRLKYAPDSFIKDGQIEIQLLLFVGCDEDVPHKTIAIHYPL
jgi:hypothetical protein